MAHQGILDPGFEVTSEVPRLPRLLFKLVDEKINREFSIWRHSHELEFMFKIEYDRVSTVHQQFTALQRLITVHV